MEQHDYIVLLEKFFKKRRPLLKKEGYLLNGFVNPEFVMSLICFASKCGKKQPSKSIRQWKKKCGTICRGIWMSPRYYLRRNGAGNLLYIRWQPLSYYRFVWDWPLTLGVEHMNKVSQDPFMVAVDYGQKANLTLPDGTKVWLNSATHLSYDAEYNKSDRKIYLDGEAYFEVAKNKDKRFIVCCNDLEIEALGTTFDVKGYCDDHSVTTLLAEGSVKVSNKTDVTLLKPGEKGRIP